MADDRDARIAQLEADLGQARSEAGTWRAEAERRDRALAEALEQQTATAEVLRVIASSPTETRTVLEALVTGVSRLCAADVAAATRLEGDEIVIIAAHIPEVVGVKQLVAGSLAGRALLERRTVSLHGSVEEQLTQYPESRAAKAGFGAQVVTPLLREGQPIGTLNLSRRAVRPFTDREIALLETFADQAVVEAAQ